MRQLLRLPRAASGGLPVCRTGCNLVTSAPAKSNPKRRRAACNPTAYSRLDQIQSQNTTEAVCNPANIRTEPVIHTPLSRSMLRVGRVRSDLSRLSQLWLAPAFARRDATSTVVRSVLPPLVSGLRSNESLDLDSDESIQSRFAYKPWRTCSLVSTVRTHTRCMCTENVSTEATDEPKEVMLNAYAGTRCLNPENLSTQDPEPTEPIKKVIECKPTDDHVFDWPIIPNSSHRDGAIYKCALMNEYISEGDIADCNETQLKPMMHTMDTIWWSPDVSMCSSDQVQFFSVVLSKSPISTGLIQLYGYIAARDTKDGMRNYIVNYRRDDPIIVQQGSLIEMTGPKRAIVMDSTILIEFDMRIKNGMHEDDDQQLIDGAICVYEELDLARPAVHRISGNCGTVDLRLAVVEEAVEATIDVVILELLSGSSLSLSCFVKIMGDYEEIQLFHGNSVQTGVPKRFVVATPCDTELLLWFKVGKDEDGWHNRCITFEVKEGGFVIRHIKLEIAAIAVRMTWSNVDSF